MKYGKEIKISLTAIFTIVILFYGINFLKGINLFKKSNQYHVMFEDITGLSKNNAVFANGFPVGTVRDISYDYEHPGQVCVEIEINDKMKLPKGTHAELVSSMLGATTMNLILTKETTFLVPGDSIQGGPHEGALEKASAMIPKLEVLMPKLDSILIAVNTLLSDPSLAQTMHNTQDITANLKVTTSSINKLLRNDVPQLTNRLSKIGDNVEVLTDKLSKVDYEQTLANVNSTLEGTQKLLNDFEHRISTPDNNIGLMLNDREMYDNINNTVLSSQKLLEDLRQHPKRYVHFSIFGKKDKP